MKNPKIQTNETPIKAIHISNLLTYLSLSMGVLGYVGYQRTGQLSCVGLGLSFSFFFDLFDGKFASTFTERPDLAKQTGAVLDSLADFGVFGILPAVTLLSLAPQAPYEMAIYSFIAIFFVICSITRLAVFHILSAKQNSFIGLPTTLVGLIISFALFRLYYPWILAVVIFILSILMVSSFQILRPTKVVMLALCVLALISASLHLLNLKDFI